MFSKIKPPLVLMLICLLTTALLVVAYNVTYVDTTGIITEKLRAGCVETIGEGDFEMLTDVKAEGVTSIIVDKSAKKCAFEIVADGYVKGGLHVIVGMDENGVVSGVSVIGIAETPGLGTKVKKKDFLDKFKGINSTEIAVDNVTGATFSSKGMKSAVALAVETFGAKKGEIFGE
ncbi:MAG: FMN-binding protein [Oscillospiraceae bacterium]